MADLISIIVPVYNTAPYLEQCLDSLLGQTYENIEILCVNDGSPDESQSILERYAAKDPRIKVIVQENQGVSAARNTALAAAAGDYVMFVDSDDWVDTDICQELWKAATTNQVPVSMCSYRKEFANKSGAVHIFAGDRVMAGENGYYDHFFPRLAGVPEEELADPGRSDIAVSPWMQLFRRDCIGDIRFVDTKKIGTEDWLFQLEVYSRLDRMAYIDKPLYHYRRTNSASLTSTYKCDLFETWDNLYRRAARVLETSGLLTRCWQVLENKRALTLLFLGLNEIKSPHGMKAQARRLREIRCSEQYDRIVTGLDISSMPLRWKAFFWLCKKKHMRTVVVLLRLIEFLRTH